MPQRFLVGWAVRITALAAVLALPVVAAAQQASGPVTIEVAQSDNYGHYLTDGNGMALYVAVAPGKFDQVNTASKHPLGTCTGSCLTVWPPALADAAPKAGKGVDASLLSTVTGPNGGTQLSYDGWPLYYFAADSTQGETFGQDVVPPQGAAFGVGWFLIAPDGSIITTAPRY